MPSALRLAARLAAAAGCGAAVALSFPPYGWWLLLVPALAGLLATLEGQQPGRAALLGGVFGLVQMLCMLPWVRVIGPDAWVALSLLQAVFFGAFGWAVVRVRRLAWWPVAVAALWVLLELGRSQVPFTGFPWGRLAFALADAPLAPFVRWIGVPALSGLVVLLAALAWWALLRLPRAPQQAGAALLGGAAVVAAGAALPVGVAGEVGTVRVAAVQGGVPGTGADGLSQQREVVTNHEAATVDFAADVAAGRTQPVDVVVWPENSTDIDPLTDSGTFQAIQRSVRSVGVPLLVGALTAGSDDDHLRNVGIVWDPETGPGEGTDK
ncbi:MAG TPA: apolipoprotein N-acyltransferase, partial [Nocardioidaceae bacterium]|nr:apolipoprotein N-acyltransferase [Nocardioidaceae bacterium]